MEGDSYRISQIAQIVISIHSLRMEGDKLNIENLKRAREFQSTPSVWRETRDTARYHSGECISIHSLRMEGDRGC